MERISNRPQQCIPPNQERLEILGLPRKPSWTQLLSVSHTVPEKKIKVKKQSQNMLCIMFYQVSNTTSLAGALFSVDTVAERNDPKHGLRSTRLPYFHDHRVTWIIGRTFSSAAFCVRTHTKGAPGFRARAC